jgi:hypothetical protein
VPPSTRSDDAGVAEASGLGGVASLDAADEKMRRRTLTRPMMAEKAAMVETAWVPDLVD